MHLRTTAILALTTLFLFACPGPDDENDGGTGGSTGGGSAGGAGGGSAGGTGGGSAGGSEGGGAGGSTGGGTGGAAQRDLDVAVVKLTPAGALDTTFGDGGVAIIDHGQATGAQRDFAWELDLADGEPVVFGLSTQPGGDSVDRFVTRLTAAGSLDDAFGTDGTAWLDLGGTNDNARRGLVLSDGKILASGYTSLPTGATLTLADGGTAPQSVNHIVLLRLNADGTRDDTFGDGGVLVENPLASTDGGLSGMAEAYVAVEQSSRYVTGGYGWLHPSTQADIDLVTFSWDTNGARDPMWGTNGAMVFNPVPGATSQDRARNGVLLPNDRIAFVGSATMSGSNRDALVAVVGMYGQLESGGESGGLDVNGFQTYSFDRPADAFWGVALNHDASQLVAAGFREAATDSNDDAVLAIIPLAGGRASFEGAVPLSATANDRFWGVAWQTDKIIAVGFVREGDDSSVAVARFNGNGTLDDTFGTDGVVTLNLAAGPGTEETARSVKVASDGSIFVVANIEH